LHDGPGKRLLCAARIAGRRRRRSGDINYQERRSPMRKLLWAAVPVFLLSCSTDDRSREYERIYNEARRRLVEAAEPVSARELYAAYDANELAADARFKGRWLRVSGTVENIGKDILGDPYVTLDAGQVFARVQCQFPKEREVLLTVLRKGMKVSITCEGAGKLMNVLLKDCILHH
jgi:hypothetical protein